MRLIIVFLAGALYPLAFAPYSLWPAVFFSLLLLFRAYHEMPKQALPIFFCFAVGKNLVGMTWVYHSVHVFGGAEPLLALFIVGLLVLILSTFYVPAGLLSSWLLRDNQSNWLSLCFFASCLTLTEWLLTWVFTGFPWLFIGHSVLDTTFSHFLPVFGALGTGFTIALLSGLIYLFLKFRIRRYLLVALIPCCLALALIPVSWVRETSEHSVALVQANIDQNKKWLMSERANNFNRHLDLSKKHWDSELIVWPEAAITLFGAEADRAMKLLDETAGKTDTNLVSGVPTVNFFQGGISESKNSLVALGRGVGTYSKVHLVPFGEYVPLEQLLRGLITFFDLPMSTMTPGDAIQPNLELVMGGTTIQAAAAICYEIAYGDSLRRRAADSQLIINVSNDTWFGATAGPQQHLQIARIRAIENGRPLLRATNNGVTASINAYGSIRSVLPQFEAGVLRTSVKLTEGRTPYSHLGDFPVLALLMTCFIWGFLRSKFSFAKRFGLP